MTVANTPRRAGPFPGDNVTATLPFSFKAFDSEDVRVDFTDVNSVTTTLVLDSDYTLTLNADQDADPGGEVELVSPLLTNELAVVLGGTPNSQALDLPSGGRFNDETIEQALDRIVFQTQQLAEGLSRAASVPTTASDASDLNEAVAVLVANIDALNIVVANIADLVTLADSITDVNTLAAINAELQAVAAIAAQIVVVAGLDTEVAALAAIAADIVTVASDSADIQLLAANIATIAAKANAGANSDITSLTGLTTPLSVSRGGTGSNTAALARAALGTNDGANITTGDIASARIAAALNASGSAPLYACRAWVNFNGTGTVAIRASGNVSSVTDVGVGQYTVNFTTAMQDANFCANITVGNTVVGTHGGEIKSDGVSTSQLNLFTYGGGAVADFPVVCVSVFR